MDAEHILPRAPPRVSHITISVVAFYAIRDVHCLEIAYVHDVASCPSVAICESTAL